MPEPSVPSKRLLVGLPTDGHGGCEYNALSVAKFASAVLGLDVSIAIPLNDRTEFLRGLAVANGLDVLDFALGFERDDDEALFAAHRARWAALVDDRRPDAVFIAMPWPARGGGLVAACADRDLPALVKFALVPEALYLPWPGLADAWRGIAAGRQIRFANSAWSARLLEGHFGLPSHSVEHFHVGPVGLRDLVATGGPAAAGRDQVRRGVFAEFGISSQAFLMTTVGRLSEQKGYPAWLAAAAALARKVPDLVFLWVGEGELREELVAGIRREGLAGRVILAGFRADVRRLLQASDIFVLPTLYEGGCSQALLEAMEEGLPIVVSGVGAMAEVVGDGRHALLAQAGDPASLVRQVGRLIGDVDLRRRLGAAAALRATHFSREIMLRRTFARLDRLLGTALADHPALAAADLAEADAQLLPAAPPKAGLIDKMRAFFVSRN